jgi:hypothetical protein
MYIFNYFIVIKFKVKVLKVEKQDPESHVKTM